MNKEYILWNVYVNIDSMDKLERKFYNLHYKYRRFVYTSQKSKLDFRSSKSFISLLEELNEAYEQIHDCSNETKNEFGEYDFPKVAYKVKSVNLNGHNIVKKYASISGTNSCRKVRIEHLFDFAYLYLNGDIKIKENGTDKNLDCLTIESSIKDVILFFKENNTFLKQYCNSKITLDAVSKLGDFPADSISELDFNYFLSKDEFTTLKNDFYEKVEENSECAVENVI